jgi:hypothetical protein
MLTNAQLPHVIAFLLLLARIGDVGSTYLISPTLKLEANPIIRRLRWPFAGITILVAAIPNTIDFSLASRAEHRRPWASCVAYCLRSGWRRLAA